MATLINVSDVSLRYDTQVLLDTATLGIADGDRIGLVGRNGCGKTTFLKVRAGLLPPDSGTVSSRRDLVATYLSQDFKLTLPAPNAGSSHCGGAFGHRRPAFGH